MSDDAWAIRRERDRWRACRLLYRAGLGVLFASVAFYFGPNYFLFGKLTWIKPSDLADEAERDFAPTVRWIKEYRRDHGELPELKEQVWDSSKVGNRIFQIRGNTIEFVRQYHLVIAYDLDNEQRPWSVRGQFTNGPIDAPPVPEPPQGVTTRATTRTSTGASR